MALAGIGGFLFANRSDVADAVLPDPTATVTQSPASYALRARLFARDGEVENAIVAWEDAIAIESENPSYYQSLVELLVEDGQSEKALEWVEVALDFAPDHAGLLQAKASAHLQRGDQLVATGDSPDQQYIYAVEAARDATQADPENARGYAYMAGGFVRQGPAEWGFAGEPAEIAHELEPDDPVVLFHAAETIRVLGNPELARVYLERAIELKPDFINAYLELSGVYRFDFDQPTLAIVTAEDALNYDDCNAVVLDRIAWYYMLSGAFPNAEDNARKATKCDESLIRARARLGHALFKQNNYQSSIQQLEIATREYGQATADNSLYFAMLGLAYVYEDDADCPDALPLFDESLSAAREGSPAELTALEGLRLCRQVQFNLPAADDAEETDDTSP